MSQIKGRQVFKVLFRVAQLQYDSCRLAFNDLDVLRFTSAREFQSECERNCEFSSDRSQTFVATLHSAVLLSLI